jgi:hypothetical protein
VNLVYVQKVGPDVARVAVLVDVKEVVLAAAVRFGILLPMIQITTEEQ